MGHRYDRVRDYQRRNGKRLGRLLRKERTLYEELADLLLEPLDSLPLDWEEQALSSPEQRSAHLMAISRMFNDFETAARLTLLGMPEQAYGALRDVIECMLLLRAFEAVPEWAKRWITRLNEYQPGTVYDKLKELGIDAPEYHLYGPLSVSSHANFVGAVSAARDMLLEGGGLVRSYFFGGHWDNRLVGHVFRILLALMLMALVLVLVDFYRSIMESNEHMDWVRRVCSMTPKLRSAHAPIDFGGDTDWSSGDPQKDRAIEMLVRKRLRFDFSLPVRASEPDADRKGQDRTGCLGGL